MWALESASKAGPWRYRIAVARGRRFARFLVERSGGHGAILPRSLLLDLAHGFGEEKSWILCLEKVVRIFAGYAVAPDEDGRGSLGLIEVDVADHRQIYPAIPELMRWAM